MFIRGAARTNIGKVRSRNEDAFGFFPELGFYVVGDGMGGHAGGEIASALAVETMRISLEETEGEDLTPVRDTQGMCSIGGRRLFIAVQQANERILEKGRQDPTLAGMGTTVAALLLDRREEVVSICHVGDTRVYRIRGGRIEQLTEDHSLVQELLRGRKISMQEVKTSPHRHILTQALGVSPVIHPTIRLERPECGDLFVICSDGVHGVVEDEEILRLVSRWGPDNLDEACEALVGLANARGGKDNSTVIVLHCGGKGKGSSPN